MTSVVLSSPPTIPAPGTVPAPIKARAVLFDLDGTLVDSAPDLAAAANAVRAAHGFDALPYERLRPMVGAGARGMVGVAFGIGPGDPAFESLRDEFLQCYADELLERTVPFNGVEHVLRTIEAAGLPWGVVTNKASRFAEPLLAHLRLDRRASVLICGDTTPHAKPHPLPLLEACRRLEVSPQDCVYVGDDLRDIQAGRAAGMATLAAGWGYLGQGDAVHDWEATGIAQDPHDLLNWLHLA